MPKAKKQAHQSLSAQLSFFDLPFEEEVELYAHMREWVMSEMMLRLAQILSRDQILECIRLGETSSNGEQAFWHYVSSIIPNSDELFSDAVAAVRDNLLNQKNLITKMV